jgi:probable FeS assembly SUF system protein SufT
MYENTEFTVKRDCEAIQIPSGQKTTIPAGTQGVITQSLGGSYTVATYQGLARVAEKDLDALGLEKPQAQQTQKAARTDGEVSDEDVWNQLRQCYDPEIPVNIVDLGLVYGLDIDNEAGSVAVTMTLTAMGCPMAGEVISEVEMRVEEIEDVKECKVNMTFDPPWSPDRMTEDAKWELGMI